MSIYSKTSSKQLWNSMLVGQKHWISKKPGFGKFGRMKTPNLLWSPNAGVISSRVRWRTTDAWESSTIPDGSPGTFTELWSSPKKFFFFLNKHLFKCILESFNGFRWWFWGVEWFSCCESLMNTSSRVSLGSYPLASWSFFQSRNIFRVVLSFFSEPLFWKDYPNWQIFLERL